MNKLRRNKLNVALSYLDSLSETESINVAIRIMSDAMHCVDDCADDEESSYDNLPEQLKCSSTGEDMDENISNLRDAYSDMEVIMDEMECMNIYDHDKVKTDIDEVYNKIKDVIDR